MANYNSVFTGAQHDQYVTKSQLVDIMYPVGSIYLTISNNNPGDLFTGRWEQIKDTFLLAAGDVYGSGTSGGATTHTHATQNHTLVASEIPAHNHGGITLSGYARNLLVDDGSGQPIDTDGTILKFAAGGRTYTWSGKTGGNAMRRLNLNASHTHTSVGGDGAHNHGNTTSASSLPPYLAVYVWRRVE